MDISIKDLPLELIHIVLDQTISFEIENINYIPLGPYDDVVVGIEVNCILPLVQFFFRDGYHINDKKIIAEIKGYLDDKIKDNEIKLGNSYLLIKDNKINLNHIFVSYPVIKEHFKNYLRKVLLLIDLPPNEEYLSQIKNNIVISNDMVKYGGIHRRKLIDHVYYGTEKISNDEYKLILNKINQSIPPQHPLCLMIPICRRGKLIYCSGNTTNLYQGEKFCIFDMDSNKMLIDMETDMDTKTLIPFPL